MTWLAHILGLDNASKMPYLAWSGIGSDVGEFAIVGALFAHYKRHTCHVDGCWRIGLHPVEQTPFRACRRHHPAVPDQISAEHIAQAHADAVRSDL